MSVKLPLKVAKLEGLKSKQYLKLLNMLLHKLRKGMTTDFMVLYTHIYPDLGESKSEKLPLFLLGKGANEWEQFFKKQFKDDKKSIARGTCTMHDNKVSISLEKGQLKNKPAQYLTLLFKKLKYELEIKGNEVTEIAEDSAKAAGLADVNRVTEESMLEVKRTEAISKFKDKLLGEAKEISALLSDFKSAYGQIRQTVVPNLKKGATSNKDLNIIKGSIEAYQKFVASYSKANKNLKKTFASANTKVLGQEKEIIKLATAVKQSKKGLAHRLADSYYMSTANRIASDAEIQAIQAKLKATIAYNKTQSTHKGIKQDLLIKAFNALLHKFGNKFHPKHTDAVLDKLAA